MGEGLFQSGPLALLFAGALILLAFLIWRVRPGALRSETRESDRAFAQAIQELSAGQNRLEGSLRQISEADSAWRLRADESMGTRLAAVRDHLGTALSESAQKTALSLGALQERLVTIDRAQEKIVRLSGDVLSLQDILSNKQARGALGEIQLADILRMALPKDAWDLQVTLGNNRRADCVIRLPKPPGAIAVDAKFPLESWQAWRDAATQPRALTQNAEARRTFHRALAKHITDIAERYIVANETADSAMMFLPSEAIYADLHAYFPEIIRKSFTARVWIVSPTTLMATLTTLRAIMQDTRTRQNAAVIRDRLRLLHADVSRMVERAGKLARHFEQAREDVSALTLSAEKVGRKASQIESLEFDETETGAPGKGEEGGAIAAERAE